ncbi:lipoprotein-releasing ABC transporter permease subunit [Halioxenophilus sp. WMMB6]|uniref:lipoprotein-releasing ABC transporter permease subunit n=1 Tax=Halioxenophilus sp. WMMB6 TaxID=3073815 RepID=UPI00295ED6D7|nr:lipoprotein-releasing ABC transporter permease subunit [Halioxenophilus sp. WMMB6]
MLSERLPLPLFIGLRYLKAKRRNQFISFVSIFSLVGMAFGCFALVVVLSVMNGFDDQIKRRILSVVPHGFIQSADGVADWQALQNEVGQVPGVVASAPFIQGYGMLSYGYGIQGVEVQGVDPEAEQQVSEVTEHMLVGSLEALQPGEFGIVIGRLLARYLGVTTGDKILLVLPQFSVTPAGVFPRQKRVTVVGVFEVGAKQDQSLALVNLEDAQKLYRTLQPADGLRVRTENLYTAGATMQLVSEKLAASYSPSITAVDWSHTQGGLFRAVKMEKIVVGCLLMIIVAVAAFNIVTSLVLMVSDKRANIAVLRTMGMSPLQVMAAFVVQGSAVGVLGIIVGSLLGSVVAIYIGDLVTLAERLFGTQLFDPNVYFVSKLPSVWQLSDTLFIAVMGLFMSLLATLYPAYQASRVQPAEALRYD